MNICKLVWHDCKEGTLRSKRLLLLILVITLQCMLVQMQLDLLVNYAESIHIPGCSYQLREMLLRIFAGCEPLMKLEGGTFPYAWFAMMICPLFLTFDYMQRDLTQFGVQILCRTNKRWTWWLAKCIWNHFSILFCYILILGTVVLFCVVAGIPVALSENTDILSLLMSQVSYFQPRTAWSLENAEFFLLLCCPLLLLIALSQLQMTLSLLIKPIYSFACSMGFFVFAIVVDWKTAFARISMIAYSSHFYENGYPVPEGMLICGFVIAGCVIAGGLLFQHYDILPQKEENG